MLESDSFESASSSASSGVFCGRVTASSSEYVRMAVQEGTYLSPEPCFLLPPLALR